MKLETKSRRAGFTLLEILVVVMIIAIMATLVAVKVIPRLGEAKGTAAVVQIKQIETGLKLYRMDSGAYPTQEQGLQALVQKPTTAPVPLKYSAEGYLDARRVPTDPWGRDYVYLIPGPEGEPYEVLSYGGDGAPGGEGEDADVSSAGQ